ncbi:MAG: amino acid adenylation domain-containing protein, partial [Pseudomonadota bacterium]|nr:amino acid adenylation domain-containing protein [Pseudomonadota bacterium]
MEDRDQLAVRVARLSPEKLAVLREHLKSRESTPKPPRAAYLHAPEHAPLSFAQQRIWFVEALAPGISAFNQAMKVTLHGRVDVHALQAALRAITERHDILRSRFVLRNDAPAQIVVESQQLILEPALLEHLSEPSRALDDWVAHFAHTPFKLSEEAPIRVGLLRIDDSTHVMMLVFHHIAFDAWSVGIFARELQELYFNLLNNTPPLLPPPSEQYASFATRERERVDADETARNIAYWHKQLSDAPLPDMPTDRPRGEHFVQRSASVSWVLPRGSRSNIETAARRHSVTPFIFLLTAYAVLMSRYCRQEDIVIGSSSANRDDLATENTIGPLINTLVLRIRLTGTLTVSEAIARVREVVIGALEHQGLPFDRLVAELGIRRDLRSHPLFQHAFVLSDVPASGVQLEGLDLTTEVIDTVNTAYELSVLAQMEQHSLRLTIQYSAELFDRDTVERLKSALEVIIHDLCGHPQRCLSDLSVLSPRDREQLLLKFNQTHAPRAAGATVHELFEHHCRSAPTAIAAQTDIGATTYQDLNVYANRLAHRILSRGIECEAPVCVLLDRSIDFLAAVLACLKAGATFVPIDLDYPPERMRMILDDCGATLVVTRHSWMDRLPLGGPSVLLVEDLEGTFSEDAQNPQIGVAPGNLAYIIYTSGSTGRPKGVAIEHRGVVNLSRWQARFFGLRPGARISQFASVGFDGAVGELVMALLNGGTLVFLARERLDPPAIVRALSDHRIDVAVFVPPLLRLMDPDVLDQRSCITIVSVGEHCPADLARRWAARCRFINGYGPTECTVYSHAYAVVEDEVVENGRVSIGMPIDNIRGYVLDAQLNPVPRGAIGELYLSGEGMARGYYGRAVLSAERFVPNPFAAVASRAPQELLVSSAWEEIQQFASRHASAESCRPVSMRAAPEVIEAALHAISDNDLRHRATKVLHSVTDSDAPEGLFRYLTEALNGCYRSCGINADVLRQLLGVHSLHGLRGADFGFGHGEVLESLASMGASAIGLDYVPSFVQDARERGFQAELVRIDAPEDIFRKESGIPAESLDFVLATLVLDRVADPLQLMRNMIGTLRAHGRMAIQTLMPVVPLDDGPGVYTRIDYTPPARRILRGVNAAEDCAHLAKILECSSVHDIRIYKFPYAVFSLDGLQIYECWSFAGTKSPDAHILDSCSRLYRTGDLARYRQDGAIDVLGRIDQQVKVRGFRVEIEEIEAVLRDHAGIVDAAVRAQQGAENGTRLAAYVVPRNSGAELNSKTLIRDLRAHLSARLPHFMVPADFEVLARLPLSSSGKVDKHRLADLSPGTPALRTPPAEVDPGNELMQTLAACWAQVLNRNVVRINDNLFELGADSILLVQIVAVLRKRGVDVSIDQLFRHQTVAELAAVLEAAGGCE